MANVTTFVELIFEKPCDETLRTAGSVDETDETEHTDPVYTSLTETCASPGFKNHHWYIPNSKLVNMTSLS